MKIDNDQWACKPTPPTLASIRLERYSLELMERARKFYDLSSGGSSESLNKEYVAIVDILKDIYPILVE